jgi:hypothetical protein
MKRTPRRLIGSMIAVIGLIAVIPSAAQADFSLTGSHAEPSNLAAGAHSDFAVNVVLPGSDDVKDLVISLPPGEVGNPQATPLCDPSALPNCPSNTQVGTVSSSVKIASLVPQTISGAVYNLVPQSGEPARFGIVLNAVPVTLPPPIGGIILPPTVVQSGASLRPSDLGLDTTVNNIPKTADVIPGVLSVPIHINSMTLTLDGRIPGTNAPFMRNPTSCTDHTVGFSADSYSSTSATASNHFTPTNCSALDFSPSFSAQAGGPGQTGGGPDRVPTTVVTSIQQDLDEAGLIKAEVAVPSNDLVANANLLGSTCLPADFQAGACPANSVVGSAIAASPLLSLPLSGNVMLVSNGSPIPDIGLDLNGQLHLLLTGSLTLSEVVTFDGLPDIPISDFRLTFSSDPGLLMANRDLCAPPAPLFHADFTGYNGATSSVDSAATVVGCGAGNNGNGGVGGKCKKTKKRKHRHHRAAESKKHHKKHSCKKKKRKKHRK